MSNYLVVNIRHWIDENEDAAAPQLKSKVEFLKEVISFETSVVLGHRAFEPPLCRRRPGRKPCQAPLSTIMEETPQDPQVGKAIFWYCPACKDSGAVYGWKGLLCDLSEDDVIGHN